MTNSPSKKKDRESQLESLAQIVKDTLSERWDDSTRKIFFFIKRSLSQFKLNGEIDESDILLEAYLFVCKKIESGEQIKNIPAYLNRVAFNIIRDKSKKQKKSKDLQTRLINNGHGYPDPISEADYADSYKINILLQALKKLKPEDFDLIQLRIVKGLSWNEISDHINSKNNKNKNYLSASALRKRGERALKRLREAYIFVDTIYTLEAGGK